MCRINIQSSPPVSVEVPGKLLKNAPVSVGKSKGRAGMTWF